MLEIVWDKLAKPEQLVAARDRLGKWSQKTVAAATELFHLPVDCNAIVLIEKGMIPGKPTKSSMLSGVDFAGKAEVWGSIDDYWARLHLFYQLRGIVFGNDGNSVSSIPDESLRGYLDSVQRSWSPGAQPSVSMTYYLNKAIQLAEERTKKRQSGIRLPKIKSSAPSST